MNTRESKRFGIAFDLEGPVVYVESIHHRAHYEVASHVGLKLDFDSALAQLPHFIGGPDLAVALEIYNLSNKNLTPEQIEQLKQKLYDELLQTTEITPREGFLKFFDKLRVLGIPTAIGSSTPNGRALVLLERSGVAAIIDRNRIVLQEDVSQEKPHPDVYLETARRMAVAPQNQIVFDDSSRGIKSAHSAGSLPIGLVTFDKEEIIKNLKAAGALIVYKSWEEIKIDEIFGLV